MGVGLQNQPKTAKGPGETVLRPSSDCRDDRHTIGLWVNSA